MNCDNNYIMLMNSRRGIASDIRQHRQYSQTIPAKSTYINSHVCKNEITATSLSSSKLIKLSQSPSKGTSSPTHPITSTTHPITSTPHPITSTMIPDILLEPPPDSMFLDKLSEYDLSVGMTPKLKDTIGRLQSSSPAQTSPAPDSVTLPGRYIRRAFDAQDTTTSPARDQDPIKEDVQTREHDLGIALKWIRQEILEMKEQDRSLLKQFSQFQDSIHQLRCLYDLHGSCSDVSSLGGSTYSLNEQTKSPRLGRAFLLDGVRCGVKPSVSLPNSPRVSRLKWPNLDAI